MNIEGKNYKFNNAQNNIELNEITKNNPHLKSIFAYFDKDGDNKLSRNEIQQAFELFTSLDNTNGVSNGTLSDDEIKKGLSIFPKEAKITVADYKNFIKGLSAVNSGRKLAGDLYNQITGPSLNSKTLALLDNIDETNVVEVLQQYTNQSPKETLASAIDNEWGLDIEDVKSNICAPLIKRAQGLKMEDFTDNQYEKINNIENLNIFILKTVNRIKAQEIEAAKEDSIDPVKDSAEYKKTYDVIDKQLVRRIPKRDGGRYATISELPEKVQAKYIEKAEYITQMVIEKCQKYEIEPLAPIVAEMLGFETGGYDFSPKVMENPGRSFKGVMQVDLRICKSIYSEGGPVYEHWHKLHYSHDDERIEELRKQYPTAQHLFEAIQSDVELGLEVGIMAFKAKIHQAKSSIAGGVKKYCGDQYECNVPNTPRNYNIT